MVRIDVITKRGADDIISALLHTGVLVSGSSTRKTRGGCYRHTLTIHAPPGHLATDMQRAISEAGGWMFGTVTGGKAGNGQVVPMPSRRGQYVGASIEDGPGPDGGAA